MKMYEQKHKPKIDRFWAIEVPIDFEVIKSITHPPVKYKAGDYLTIDVEDGLLRIKTAEEMQKAVPKPIAKKGSQ